MVRNAGMEMVIFARRRPRGAARYRDMVCVAGPARPGALALARRTPMDEIAADGGTSHESAHRTDVDLASIASSASAHSYTRFVLLLLRRLYFLVLDAAIAEAHDQLDRFSCERNGLDSFYRRADRNAHHWLELGSHTRTPLAFCDSATDRCARPHHVASGSTF